VILDVLQDLGTPGPRDPRRPRLPPASESRAVPCGPPTVSAGPYEGFLLGDPDEDHYDRLCQAGVIGDLIYINDDPVPRHA
jgi:hypothetical protein